MTREAEDKLVRRCAKLRKGADLLFEELTDPRKAVGIFWIARSPKPGVTVPVDTCLWALCLHQMKEALDYAPAPRKGRPADPDRAGLDATVGAVLKHAGVHLAKSRDGEFAAVLSLVHEEVGIAPGTENFAALKQAVDAANKDVRYSWCETSSER